MEGRERKAAIAAYKEREAEAGIYAVRCAASGCCWVGATRDLPAIRNRHWFTLRQRSHPRPALQAAWDAHGPDAFAFEVVERLEFGEEEGEYVRASRLKDRLAHWRAALGGEAA